MNNDELGNRMKAYESHYASQILLPRIPICSRIDGRAFSTFCKGLKRPYDERLSELMVRTTKFLVEETQANCGYTQSDEISLVWHTRDRNVMTFFGGRVSKMTSVLASMATAFFNKELAAAIPEKKDQFAFFDARVWCVPLEEEAASYFIWRELDATRNSISMAAQSNFSHKELQYKSSSEMQEMLWSQKNINWNNYPAFFKRGTYVQKRKVSIPFDRSEIEKLPPKHAARTNPNLVIERQKVVRLEMPPILKVVNRKDVLLFGADPQTEEVEIPWSPTHSQVMKTITEEEADFIEPTVISLESDYTVLDTKVDALGRPNVLKNNVNYGVYDSFKLEDLLPEIAANYEITLLHMDSFNTGRDRFRVVCKRCQKELHWNTNGPQFYIQDHEKVCK